MERRRQHDIPNWSQISVPDSQSRNYKGERFPREAELHEILMNSIHSSADDTQVNRYNCLTNVMTRVLKLTNGRNVY